MSKVILLIDGTEVYNNSTSSSTSTTPDVEYTRVENPKIGNNYYYMEKERDEDNKPMYKASILKQITSEPDGPMSSRTIYTFDDGHKAIYTIFKRSDSGGGGGNPEEENYESREKKEDLPERNFEYN
jgi:hypothetical protein